MNVHFRAFNGPYDWGWVRQHLQPHRVSDTCGIMAIDMDKGEYGETVGAVIFDSWTENSMQAHIIVANPMLLRHGFLEECFDYAFNVGGRGVMYGLVPSDNEKALALDKHIGFVEIARLNDAVREGVDMVVMEMRKENCRWLPELPGEKVA